ncbi:MAG: DUF1707 domain-containing protein [Treponema sp.]|jgi:hypothetical protein|nr:DUF1707 domain-containing protein [Treponema sp.]
MVPIDAEKDRLVQKLSEQYAHNIISMDEYERMLEYVTKIETNHEIDTVAKVIQENDNRDNHPLGLVKSHADETHVTVFSWSSSQVKPVNGHIGKYVSVFGANKIIIDALPRGKNVLQVSSVCGLTEIIVAKNIKIINKALPICAGIFTPDEGNSAGDDAPELYITGTVFFGNITIIKQ